jgi:hypothetical protein
MRARISVLDILYVNIFMFTRNALIIALCARLGRVDACAVIVAFYDCVVEEYGCFQWEKTN